MTNNVVTLPVVRIERNEETIDEEVAPQSSQVHIYAEYQFVRLADGPNAGRVVAVRSPRQ